MSAVLLICAYPPQVLFEYLAYKMGVAKGTLFKRIKQELKRREVRSVVKSEY